MRTSRISNNLLPALLFLVMSGCACSSSYLSKGPEVKTNTVKINNCKADPDTVRVPKGGTLTWTVDPPEPGHTYSIHFPKRKPIPSTDAPTGQAQQVTGDVQCSISFGLSCTYGYDLIKDGSTTCPDPGVHVGPG